MKNSLLPTLFKGTIINSPARLNKIARECRWMQRKPKKLKPINFIHGILYAVSNGDASFRLLATAIGLRLEKPKSEPNKTGDTISKQALWERVDESAVEFFKQTFEELVSSNGYTAHDIPNLPQIKRLIVEDSTKIDLPDELSIDFPASGNSTDFKGAGLRLQGAFDLIAGEVIRLDLTEYYRQDTTASGDIIDQIQPDDLILRDLGYLVMESLIKIQKKGAHFISRYKTDRVIFQTELNGGAQIDLIKLLKRKVSNEGDAIDIDIVMGRKTIKEESRLKCRLVAVRLPDAVARKRLAQAEADATRRGKPLGKRKKQLLKWTILITSLPREEFPGIDEFKPETNDLQRRNERGVSVEMILDLYQLRWRIEIIFKSLKSYTPVNALANHRSNANHLQVLLYGWLCLTVMATKQGAFALAKNEAGSHVLKPNLLSIFKVMPKVFELFRMSLLSSCSENLMVTLHRMMEQSEYHDRFEKRKLRKNMAQMTAEVLGFTEAPREPASSI